MIDIIPFNSAIVFICIMFIDGFNHVYFLGSKVVKKYCILLTNSTSSKNGFNFQFYILSVVKYVDSCTSHLERSFNGHIKAKSTFSKPKVDIIDTQKRILLLPRKKPIKPTSVIVEYLEQQINFFRNRSPNHIIIKE